MPAKSYFPKKVKQALALVFTLLLLSGGLYYFLKDEPLPVQQTSNEQKNPVKDTPLKFSSSSITEEQNGRRTWELTADTIETLEQNKKISLAKVTGTFYQENNGSISMVADNAFLDTVTKNIDLSGQVKFTSSEGATLTSPQAFWNNVTHLFTASGGIVFVRDDVVITGESVEADNDLKKVIVKGRAHLTKGGSASGHR